MTIQEFENLPLYLQTLVTAYLTTTQDSDLTTDARVTYDDNHARCIVECINPVNKSIAVRLSADITEQTVYVTKDDISIKAPENKNEILYKIHLPRSPKKNAPICTFDIDGRNGILSRFANAVIDDYITIEKHDIFGTKTRDILQTELHRYLEKGVTADGQA